MPVTHQIVAIATPSPAWIGPKQTSPNSRLVKWADNPQDQGSASGKPMYNARREFNPCVQLYSFDAFDTSKTILSVSCGQNHLGTVCLNRFFALDQLKILVITMSEQASSSPRLPDKVEIAIHLDPELLDQIQHLTNDPSKVIETAVRQWLRGETSSDQDLSRTLPRNPPVPPRGEWND